MKPLIEIIDTTNEPNILNMKQEYTTEIRLTKQMEQEAKQVAAKLDISLNKMFEVSIQEKINKELNESKFLSNHG
jgi:predicted HicB family RNase H-like nuclease